MNWYDYLIILGATQALYAFRMILKYFQYLEGRVRNGTIITNGIAAGLIWPLTLLLDGVRGVWEEIGPVKVIDKPAPQFHEGPSLPEAQKAPMSIADIIKNNEAENLQ